MARSSHREELRIGSLMVLGGVNWPTASVLLHFGHKDPYPILDFRALESFGIPKQSFYNFEFWRVIGMRNACRKLVGSHSMRRV